MKKSTISKVDGGKNQRRGLVDDQKKKDAGTALKKNELVSSKITYTKREETKPQVSKTVGDTRKASVVKKSSTIGVFEIFKTALFLLILFYIFSIFMEEISCRVQHQREEFSI